MAIYSCASKKTQYSCLFIAVLAFLFLTPSIYAGTIGTPEAETERLQQELDAARNAFDAAVLRPGVKLSDPSVKAKAATLDEKTRALQRNFQDVQVLPKAAPTAPPPLRASERDDDDGKGDTTPPASQGPYDGGNQSPPPPPRVEAPPEPETVLSGEKVQAEIQYSKKSKPGKMEKPIPHLGPKVDSAVEPVPEDNTKPDAAGLSEIQYPKKKPKKKP